MASKTKKFRFGGANISNFSVEGLFTRKREPGPPRVIFVNEPLPKEYFDAKGKVHKANRYITNQVISSKYTLVTFVPRNLLEQFRRVANIFFLVVAILQFFNQFSTISPGVTILPLLIIVFITGCKDGYEDYRRHQADRNVNYSSVKALRGGGWENLNASDTKSKTFIRGLIPKNKGKRPADPEQASAPVAGHDHINPEDDYDSEPAKHGDAHWKRILWEDLKVGDFVKIMDDEAIPADILICATSDPENVAFIETKNLDGETNLKARNAIGNLTHLRSAVDCASSDPIRVHCDRPENNLYRLHAAAETNGQKAPADLTTTLLRGTVLRNTEWVIGIVMFTGEDSKIVMNAGAAPSKRSKVERQMNPQVVINLILMAVLATICGIADALLEQHYYPREAPWLYNDFQPDDNPQVNGVITWVYAIITFQNVVPISLYLSLEVVVTLQAAWIYLDKDIWYEKLDQAATARSWNLASDLGQVEYIFSDKTGTLTQNLMVFRQCTVGGKAYRGDDEDDVNDRTLTPTNAMPQTTPEKQHSSFDTIGNNDPASGSGNTSKVPSITTPAKPIRDDTIHFHDKDLAADIESALVGGGSSPEDAAHARSLNGFFSVLALCHTVVAATDRTTGKITYKAQSPDEAALVQAAADVGFVFIGKDKDILSIRTPASPEIEQYELLNVLEFTSARKRMSVVVRKLGDDSRLFLMSKGADNVIFERLKAGASAQLKADTERHLSEFANEGLRTLTLAYKVISVHEYEAWSERYYQATVAMDNREEQIEAVSDELEQDLRLLGATAIEDKLQDGVPEAIADLKRAGIKIWVATGDKLETAIAIGRSTNLVGHESNIIIVRGGSRPVEKQLTDAIHRFFPDSVGEDLEKLEQISRPTTPMSTERPNLQRSQSRVSVASIVGEDNGDRPGGFILVVDGAALLQAFDNEENKDLLLRLAMLCEGVICCRVSPLQKALIVRLVKDGLNAMTLAVGDGANDVSMIQAADVGVGISGEEGLQAVNSSDYAIGQFRFLKKLILVHGHWSYARCGIMILNFFYKNIVLTGILFWFMIYCGWSAQFYFDYVYILFWNTLWSIAPVVGVGLFDRILDYPVLMDTPELFHFGRNGTWYTTKNFFLYMLDATYQSVIIFFFVTYTYDSTTPRTDGYNTSLYEWSTVAAMIGAMTVDIFTGMDASAWTWWLVFAVSIGIVLVWGFTLIYSAISPTLTVTTLYGNYYYLFTSAYFWLVIPIAFLLALTPRYLAKAYKSIFDPSDIDIVRYIRKYEPYKDLHAGSETHLGIGMGVMKEKRRRSMARRPSHSRRQSVASTADMDEPYRPSLDPIRSASRMDMSTGLMSVDRGFDFATEEGGGIAIQRIQSNLSTKHNATRKPRFQSIRKGVRKLSTLRSP